MVHLGPTRAELQDHPFRVYSADSVWRRHADVYGKSNAMKRLTLIHSQANLLTRWKLGGPKQLNAHRAQPLKYECLAENTSSLVNYWQSRGRFQFELDIAMLKTEANGDQHFVLAHDLLTYRTTMLGNLRWSDLNIDEVEGAPLIIRDVKDNEFASTFILTSQNVRRLEHDLTDIFCKHPGTTLFLDLLNGEAAPFVAWLSHRPGFAAHVVVKFYGNCYLGGHHFISEVERFNPHPEWRATVFLMPRITTTLLRILIGHLKHGEFLDDLAPRQISFPLTARDYAPMLANAWSYLDTFLSARLQIPSVEIPTCCLGECYDKANGNAQVKDIRISEPAALEAIMLDSVMIALCKKLREIYTDLPIGGVCRTYDYSIRDSRFFYHLGSGRPVLWPQDQRKFLYEASANISLTSKYADWIVAENIEDCVSYFQGSNHVACDHYTLNDCKQ